MKKKVLLLDTSFSAKPIYEYLINTGFIVYVVGGNPEAVLARTTDNYVNIDYSDMAKMIDLIQRLKIDYLVPGGNDLSYKVCAEINEVLQFYNIDSIEINETLSDKEKFKKIAIDLNLHIPPLIESEHIKNSLPVIVKPVDAFGGSGITKIDSTNIGILDQALIHAKECSESGRFIVERFIEGQLYSHSAFLSNKDILTDFIVEEHCITNPYAVDTSWVDYNFDPEILNNIRQDILKLAQKLNLSDGLIHTQFICNGSDFWLIEVTRRCPGDLYTDLIELSTGFPYVEYYAKPFLNKKLLPKEGQTDKKRLFRHTIVQSNASHFHSFHFNVPVKIKKFVPLAQTGTGDKGKPYSRIGLVFIDTESHRDFDNLIQKSLEQTLYQLQ